ncbi:MAG TPA: UvrD-helicase domain-containing protein [Micromonosporaceae bacterium]
MVNRPAPQTVAEEIAVEQRHVDRVYARLEVLRREATQREAAGYRLARVGTFSALVERDAMVYHLARRRRALDSEHEGLVFGRLDLRGGETRYVGRLGLRDDDAKPLVIDWRAPAAAPFYRATAADPQGVVRRRMITSAGEKVTGIEDDLLDPDAAPPDMRVVGDGALIATLNRATGTAMRDIVATIQREQDEAIRSPGSGVTLVQGGPGTGKTAVALHRVAYLLYSDRSRFAGGGVLVVGPSPVFVRYISRVLPSLGEEDVTLRALGSLVVDWSGEPVEATRHDPPESAVVKGSLRMARVLARAARDAAPGSPDGFRLLYRGQLLQLTAQDLDRLRDDLLASGAQRNRVRAKAAGLVLDALWRQSEQLLAGHLRRDRAEFAEEIAERREFVAFMGAWWPRLRPVDVLGWFADRDRLHRYADGILKQAEIDRLVFGDLTVEDVPLLDELDELLGRPPARPRRVADPYTVAGVRELATRAEREAAARAVAVERSADYREYAHVVVDEAQDVSPMQWRMLGRRGEHASWTIVGDPAQSAWAGDAAETRRARDAALGSRRRYRHTLTTNYRNSVEIFAVAARVIRAAHPDIELPQAVRASGVDPTHHVVAREAVPDAVRSAVSEVLDEVSGTVGVVTPVGRREEVAGWLAATSDARLQVVDCLEAKGMEYDAVVLVEPDEIGSGSGVRTLYVALSRATQRLTTVGSSAAWLNGTT